jgi:hypothetical protein
MDLMPRILFEEPSPVSFIGVYTVPRLIKVSTSPKLQWKYEFALETSGGHSVTDWSIDDYQSHASELVLDCASNSKRSLQADPEAEEKVFDANFLGFGHQKEEELPNCTVQTSPLDSIEHHEHYNDSFKQYIVVCLWKKELV